MPLALEQMNLIAAFDTEAFFKTSHSGTRAPRRSWLAAPSAVTNGPEIRLRGLIQLLGIAHQPATPRGASSDIGRAAANIETWMTYLPKNCVRTMVRDGWHWTT
jgi:hypothetical protein